MGNIEALPYPTNCFCLSEKGFTQSIAIIYGTEMPFDYHKKSDRNDVNSSVLGTSGLEPEAPFFNKPAFKLMNKNYYKTEATPSTAGNRYYNNRHQLNLFSSNQELLDSFSSTFTDPSVWKDTASDASTTATIETNCTYLHVSSDPWKTHRDVSSITSLVVSILIVITNWFVLGSIFWSLWQRHKRHTAFPLNRSYIFIFNLALADLFVGIANVVSFSLNLGMHLGSSYENCLVEICFIITPCCASITTMTVVGIDRYLTVMHPFKYKSLVTVRKALLIVAFVWVGSFLLGFAPLMGWGEMSKEYYDSGRICSYLFVVEPSYVIFTLFGAFVPQLVIIVYLYSQIFKVSKRHSMQIFQLRQASKAQLPRAKENGYGTFLQEDIMAPVFSRSCPVSPLMPRIKVDCENGDVAKTQQPPRRKPFRTVSFGPASFGDDLQSGSRVFSRNSSLSFESEFIRSHKSSLQEQEDNVFENNLSLPGAVFSQKRLPEVNTNQDETLYIPVLQKDPKNSNTQKLKRSVSYAGSVALTSLASQISNRFGNLKKEVAKRNVKALRTVGVVIGLFFFMWSPFLLLSVIQVLCGSGCQLQNLVGTYLLLLGITNSAINPLVYTYTNRELKKHVTQLCCKKKKPNLVTNHRPSGSESFVNTSIGNSFDPSRGVPAWMAQMRHTRGSLRSNPFETTKSDSGRSSTASGRISVSNPRNSRNNVLTRRTSNSLCYVKPDNVTTTNLLPLPPSGRKKSIVKIDDSTAKVLNVSTSFMM